MKYAGVVIDKWKLSIFKQHLNRANYQYTEHAGATANTLLLKVKYTDVSLLQPIIQAANDECAKVKLN